ncbi:MAG: hypothetical protein A2W22_01145 [Candidatus Levybacteria bacterium RBG_16_35_11]|nr:MAG: hypothetical protein A2W22_01145 [Candidatus Levybacteria bacterium RBG_16_35_11]
MENNEKQLSKILNKKPTYREETNALICECLRNGFIEDLHSRISDEEMKKLMIETSANLEKKLIMKDKHPKEYKKFINFITLTYTKEWSTDLTEYELKEDRK